MSDNAFLKLEEALESVDVSGNPILKACEELLSQYDDAHATSELPESVKTIKPIAGFCIKTTGSDEQKVFLNICHSLELPQTEDITEDELTKILQSDEPSSYRVPMSLGEPREESDKGGKPCLAYDVVINSEFYKKVSTKELFKMFLISIALEGVEDKYNCKLNRDNCIVLKNKTYHGTLQEQHIRTVSAKQLVTEIEERSEEKNKQNEKIKELTAPKKPGSDRKQSVQIAKIPEYLLRKEPHNAAIPDRIIGEFLLDHVKKFNEINLDLGEDRLVLDVSTGTYSPVDIYLPFNVDQDKSYAEFKPDTGVLKVTCPVIKQQS